MGTPAPTGQKVGVLWRYVAAHAAGGLSLLVVMGALPADKAQALLANFQRIYTDLQDIFGQLAAVWVLVGPGILAVLVKLGFDTTKVSSLADNLVKIATSNTPQAHEAQEAIVKAAVTAKVLPPDPPMQGAGGQQVGNVAKPLFNPKG